MRDYVYSRKTLRTFFVPFFTAGTIFAVTGVLHVMNDPVSKLPIDCVYAAVYAYLDMGTIFGIIALVTTHLTQKLKEGFSESPSSEDRK